MRGTRRLLEQRRQGLPAGETTLTGEARFLRCLYLRAIESAEPGQRLLATEPQRCSAVSQIE